MFQRPYNVVLMSACGSWDNLHTYHFMCKIKGRTSVLKNYILMILIMLRSVRPYMYIPIISYKKSCLNHNLVMYSLLKLKLLDQLPIKLLKEALNLTYSVRCQSKSTYTLRGKEEVRLKAYAYCFMASFV